jgi:general secretion pathway protein I
MKKRRGLSGFTLLEVLVALAILAISSMAVIRQTSYSLTSLQQLTLKTMATLVADNYASQFAITAEFPEVGRSSEVTVINDLHWEIGIEVSDTSEPWLRKIEVSVALDDVDIGIGDVDNQVLASVITYRGKY